ncbi:hypothetical protein G7Z17_g12087 [Cylindrodendrum hubeiense]|uniref:RNA helicase n=1 Tax=Cylindrodendrum hubeiense TaxID=595255 RepID=A0A9P5H3S3_9HYPO|nr:hypothetical protein G7Z17_g12087 [Cylindrodendrum hubeiense]
MARPRDSRSPSPAGSPNSSRRPRKDDDRRDKDRRDDGKDHPRGTRSRSPDIDETTTTTVAAVATAEIGTAEGRETASTTEIDRQTANRTATGEATGTSEGERIPATERVAIAKVRLTRHARSIRDESRHQKTPITDSGNAASSEVRRPDHHPGTTPVDRVQAQKPKAAASQAEVDKKAERLAKLEAWKKKKEIESQKQKEVNPSQTRNLLAEMDMKASGASSKTVSPVVSAAASPAPKDSPSAASPVAPYTGKFDPKAIAKKSAASRSHEAGMPVLGLLGSQPEKVSVAVKQTSIASALPANRLKASGFGFTKSHAETDKLPSKRKLDLDEEDTTKRKLTKLPALPIETDDTPYADQDEDDESDGDVFAETEEEAAAAARAAHEKRLQAESQAAQAAQAEQEAKATEAATNDQATTNGEAEKPTSPESMDVDEGNGVDPLDAFMADLKQPDVRKSTKTSTTSKKVQEPEAYFSDDDYAFKAKEDGDANAFLAMTNKRKKKEIPTIDYSKIEIEPIRKNFWVEPAELATLTEAEVADLRLELDGIKVNGKDVPKPVQKWAQCGLTRQTLDVIDHLGYEKPTPIQMQAVPTIMSGRDVVGVAKTGSGKTVAFLLPMFRHIKDQTPLKDSDGPIGLIMTPTRELATQIHRDCKPFLKMMGLRSVCAYGGAPIREQIAELKRGAEIVVCTPGRMIDLLAANQGRVTNLKRVSYVVLDEADRMFDMGFEPQVMKIFANMRPDRQTILFSATMPRIIDSLTKKVLKAPVEITVGGRSVVAKEIEQIVEVREETTKFLRVLELLGDLYDRDEDARTLIFVERQEKADDLLKELMMKGYPCMSIHGGKDQIDRDSTISDFKKGVVPILIATSVAARGLDVKQLKLVVNYDAPNHLEDYVHRAGRTGRAGNTGVAVTFVTPEQENCAVGISKALEQSGQPVPERLNEMRKAHREKVKSGKAKDTSGFGGKGLDRLDQEREAARLRERKTHKAEGEEEEDKEEKKDDEEKAEKALHAIRAAASGVQSRETAKTEQPEVKPVQPVIHGPTATTKDGKAKDPLDKVSSAVSAINSRLGKAGQLRAGQPIDNKGPDAGAYHATLEINDFPQKARWAVTNRTNVAKILEATGTSITTKGNFYPLGKEAPAGAEPKLYILIEGDTEVVVSSALTELTRLLREGTIAAADADSRAPASGRYTIT